MGLSSGSYKVSPGVTPPAGGSAITALTYNNAGQMSAAKAGSTTSASYTYDAFGNRLLKTIGSTTTFYDYCMGQLLEEANATTGTAALDYIYMDGRPVATLNPSTKLFTYLHTDRLGTSAEGNQQQLAGGVERQLPAVWHGYPNRLCH